MKKEIELKFETDLPGDEYKLENNVFQLPLISTPEKLNQLLNKILSLDPPKKFSFLIHNTKLTSSLEEFINTNLLTTEQTIEIYYILDINQPEKTNTIKEDEWIRCIENLQIMKYNPNKLENYSVGLFNGEISFYSGSTNNKIYSLKQNSPTNEDTLIMLNDIKFFKLNNENENHMLIKVCKNSNNIYEIYNIDINNQSNNLIFSEEKKDNEYYNNIALNPLNYNLFSLSGTENDKGVIKIFKIPENLSLNETKNQNSKKKRKMESNLLKPELVFENLHNKLCSNSIFLDKEYIVSGGDDYTLKVYNIINKNLFMTYNTNYKNVSSMIRVTNKTFLVGYIDGTIKYYDLNNNKAANIFKDPKSTYGYISDICMSNDKDNHPMTFITSSYDSNLRLWDIRGGRLPLYTINTDETEKNYAVKFHGNNNILSGGDGSSINIFHY
jgi:WD40 repeat protein